ncbi:hypothetical protein COW36_01080 [bacterium (Candidatus Blackallbacteria) CG17_big_fil_post_rev_8_21_14_2_50_48_46]|uniref:Uncharacterized protein n=1 Tax=bacterium (Candidatus Blackallbacteria) CG17_big_fil_post_rev_8_21_14_2_50_48_46 TaxID=2014261 RepID=A0A2M7GBA0_9BACT|nr:MAG: hypothetical protein COW64_10095 [bacterium (Candidatus Blackallbacteria) CG18_big_fil_WC_8_21_14_2_50_49_26]PIW19461.1 MAG: hypothetical protein COW36_01080 [bacterium (Candidatus Blackallbacteria) CG17_big_fil_post_rev_8_21_14_2_50_48_46]PIW48935.1 MAG: hypothetical protein COW20_07375 [bacterium (Candidatus Blackallbacteria) CG13_big_fil_rev_8_21_14_2_50_49_14]
MPITTSESVQKLCSLAVQQNLASASQLAIAVQTYILMKIEALQCNYLLEHNSGRLLLRDRSAPAGNEAMDEWASFDMPAPAFQGEWAPYASNKVALFNEKGVFTGVQDRGHSEITPSFKGGYVWLKNQAYQMNMLLNTMVPVNDVKRGPYDFFIPPHQNTGIFLIDRAAGTLFMSDFTLSQTSAQLQVRDPGSKKAINVAYSQQTKTIYITDHHTPDILVINPSNRQKERIYTEHGILGNLTLDDKLGLIFAVLADASKEPAVLIFSIKDYSHQGTILLPGKRFSEVDDPCDLIAISPDRKSLMVMTYTDEGALFTPIISQIDIEKKQLVKSYNLNHEDKPVGFAFLQADVKAGTVVPFDKMLADKGIIHKIQLAALVRQIEMLEKDKDKPLLDQDIESAMSHIQGNFSNEEIDAVTEVTPETVTQMAQDTFFEWQGRGDMKPEEKQVFVERLSQMKADPKVSKTNGVFVLNWIKGLMG